MRMYVFVCVWKAICVCIAVNVHMLLVDGQTFDVGKHLKR